MTNDQMREAFEQEAKRQGFPLVRDSVTGWYEDSDTLLAWHWWQAALASRSTHPAAGGGADAAQHPTAVGAGVWEHIKSGGLYELLCHAMDEATGRSLVVYKSLDTGTVWSRPQGEFFAKFRRPAAPPPPEPAQ